MSEAKRRAELNRLAAERARAAGHPDPSLSRAGVAGEAWAKGFRAGEEQAAETLGEAGFYDAAKFLRARFAHERTLETAPSSGVTIDDLRSAANDLIDAISTPKGRDFQHAWEAACVIFGRFGAEPTLLAEVRAEEREACADIHALHDEIGDVLDAFGLSDFDKFFELKRALVGVAHRRTAKASLEGGQRA